MVHLKNVQDGGFKDGNEAQELGQDFSELGSIHRSPSHNVQNKSKLKPTFSLLSW
jgi:hypothetical protein